MGSVKNDTGTAPGAGSADISTEHLLRSSAWQSRLDAARAQREKILAERSRQGDEFAGPKPWEKSRVATAEELAARRARKTGAPIAPPTLVDPVEDEAGKPGAMLAAMRAAQFMRHQPVAASVAPIPAPQKTALPAASGLPSPVRLAEPMARAADVPAAAVPARGRPGRVPVIAGAFAMGLAIGLGVVFVPRLLDVMNGAGMKQPPILSSVETAGATVRVAVATAPGAGASDAGGAVAVAAEAVAPPVDAPAARALSPNLTLTEIGLLPAPVREAAAPVVPAVQIAAEIRSPRPASPDMPEASGTLRNVALLSASLRPGARPAVAGLPPSLAMPAAPPADLILPASWGPRAPSDTASASASFAPSADRPDLLPPAAVAALPPVHAAPSPWGDLNIMFLAPKTTDPAARAAMAAKLAKAGFAPDVTGDVAFKVNATHVRFYYPDDASAARAVADSVGGIARDFTGFDPLPPEGTVEVWLGSGDGSPVAAAAAPAAKKVAAKSARKQKASSKPRSTQSDVAALKARIIARLRNDL